RQRAGAATIDAEGGDAGGERRDGIFAGHGGGAEQAGEEKAARLDGDEGAHQSGGRGGGGGKMRRKKRERGGAGQRRHRGRLFGKSPEHDRTRERGNRAGEERQKPQQLVDRFFRPRHVLPDQVRRQRQQRSAGRFVEIRMPAALGAIDVVRVIARD